MSLVWVRHGETALNRARVLQPADTPLSATGREQARAVALRLAQTGVSAIVSSDQPRALETAQAIAAATGHAVISTPLLQERNFGDWRGRPYDGLGFNPLTTDEPPPGGECSQAFRQRVAEAFDWVLKQHEVFGPDVVVVSHGLVIHTVLQHHVTLADGGTAPQRLGNTSVTRVCAAAPHRVDGVDCTRHLTGDWVDRPESLSGG